MKKIISFFTCIFSILMFLNMCSKEKSVTDITYITKANKFITAQDIKKGIKKTTSSMQQVVMSHKKHNKTGLKCARCHHKKFNDARVKKCAYCHKGLQGTVLLHKTCIDCHEIKQKGPTSCYGCHPKSKKSYLSKEMRQQYKNTFTFNKAIHNKHTKWNISCKVCHHKDHDKDTQQKCAACHKGRSQMKIMHYFCKDCHKGNNRLRRKVGPITCSGCHLSKD